MTPSTADIHQRTIGIARSGDEDLGPLAMLPGVWANCGSTGDALVGRGWNLIALPHIGAGRPDYRVLLNQFNERLEFSLVDKNVPNRGVRRNDPSGLPNANTDQQVGTLDYEQSIEQIASADNLGTDLAGKRGDAIHHEPGLFLYMQNETEPGPNIGRLATVPHGDAVLALGKHIPNDHVVAGMPAIAPVDVFPIGVPAGSGYLAPYQFFIDSPFQGDNASFDISKVSDMMNSVNSAVEIERTTILSFDTETDGGISNIPFVVKQADATSMTSTFWIQELTEKDKDGHPRLRLQYLQIVMLDFFDRIDGTEGLIRWPHVSFNTMEKISNTPDAGYGALKVWSSDE
ncbi:hypothetical protein G3I13_14415 [Streptomyces sp. SID6673]|nr:hypothetical protein [Streptomyces sp. SID11726]NEB25533.1 hypothetical protein [Streptomyces sp. SID6673]